MDFNELVKKYHNEQTTEEETAFVEKTVGDARDLAKTHLKGDKNNSLGRRLKRKLIKLMILIAVVALAYLYCFLSVSNYARENLIIGKAEADRQAQEFIRADLGLLSNQVEIGSYKRKLVFTFPMQRSYYLYEYTIVTNTKGNYQLTIDSYSGLIEYAKY